MAAEPLSLMEFVHALLADAHLRGLFADDPRTTLHAHGLGDLSPVDVHDALDLVQDNEITDFHDGPTHPQPSWDIDSEAFGHGGAFGYGGAGAPAMDGFAWSGSGEPADGIWTGATPTGYDGAGAAETDGWADHGYGTGHDIGPDLGPADDPGPDLHHHG